MVLPQAEYQKSEHGDQIRSVSYRSLRCRCKRMYEPRAMTISLAVEVSDKDFATGCCSGGLQVRSGSPVRIYFLRHSTLAPSAE